MNKRTFLGKVNQALKYGEDHLGMHRSDVQHAYAEHIAKGLLTGQQEEWGYLLAEAETGTGKTIGYLVPSLLMQAMTGQRVFISTFTIALQRQIMAPGGDMEKAVAMVQSVAGDSWNPSVALRVGRRNFVDIEKVRARAELLTGEAAEAARDFLKWAEQSDTGEWREYLERQESDGLPCGWTVDDVCLDSSSDRKEASHVRYLSHVNGSRQADVVVTNHALSALNAKFGKRLLQEKGDARGIAALIIDECDRMPDAAASVTGSALALRKFLHAVNASMDVLTGVIPHDDALNTIALMGGLADDLTDMVDFTQGLWGRSRNESGDGDTLLLDEMDAQQANHLSLVLDQVNRSTDLVMTALDGQDLQGEAAAIIREEMDGLSSYADALSDFVAYYNGYASSTESVKTPILSITWSPKMHYPSLSVFHLFPARMMKQMWSRWIRPEDGVMEDMKDGDVRAHCMILTSATISARSDSGEHGYIEVSQEYGLWNETNPCDDLNKDPMFAPTVFGQMDIVFPAGDAPNVTIYRSPDDDEHVGNRDINPEWVRYVALAAVAAHRQGGHTLVLTSSYKGTDRIGKAIIDMLGEEAGEAGKVIVKRQEMHLSQVLDRMKSLEDSIFVTAGSWEGFDLGAVKDIRGRRMYLSHVVVAQIPYGASDQAYEEALRQYMRRRGKSKEKIDGAIYYRRRSAALRKMRQGIGRGIRHHEDRFTLWLCDPRMPRSRQACQLSPSTGKRRIHTAFQYAIPDRFRNNVMGSAWEKGRVLTLDGDLVGGESDRASQDEVFAL